MIPYRAVVVGATGAVGGALVRELLASPLCTAVVALARRPVVMFDALPGRTKLRVEVIDLGDLEGAAARLAAGCEVAFNTMGIGQPRKVPYQEFRRVDVDYAGAFARGAARAGARHISLLSAVGADKTSRNRYVRTKGEAEQAVIDAGIARTSLFRPSVLVTKDIRYGLQDRLTQAVFPVLSHLLPRRLHGIRVEDLGRAMRLNAERTAGHTSGGGGRGSTPAPGVEILYWPEFQALLRSAAGEVGSGRPASPSIAGSRPPA